MSEPGSDSKKYAGYVVKCLRPPTKETKEQKFLYYVGRADSVTDAQKRYEQHCAGTGSAVTSHYKPVFPDGLIEIRENQNKWQEDDLVFEMMEKYGIDDVRGGTYVNVEDFTPQQKAWIQKKLNSVNDKCYTCGASGHFSKDCKQEVKKKPAYVCFRCGLAGHFAQNCLQRDSGYVANRTHKPPARATATPYPHSKPKPKPKPKPALVCIRCGRNSHTSIDCYATHNLDGNLLTSPKLKAVPFRPWDDAMDRDLWLRHKAGENATNLATRFSRTEAAILARIEQINSRIIDGPSKTKETEEPSWCTFM